MTRPPPPPSPLVLGPTTPRLARIARMDRGALRELIAELGALIDAALRARAVDAAAFDDAITASVRTLWGELALWSGPAPDEAAVVLACALAAVPLASLEGTGLDARLVTRLGARVAAGVASDAERALWTAQRAQDARLDAAARELDAACAAVDRGARGAGRALALWATIEPQLK